MLFPLFPLLDKRPLGNRKDNHTFFTPEKAGVWSGVERVGGVVKSRLSEVVIMVTLVLPEDSQPERVSFWIYFFYIYLY